MDNLSDFGSCDLHARALRGILWLGEADTSADQAMRLTSGRPTSHPVVGQRAHDRNPPVSNAWIAQVRIKGPVIESQRVAAVPSLARLGWASHWTRSLERLMPCWRAARGSF